MLAKVHGLFLYVIRNRLTHNTYIKWLLQCPQSKRWRRTFAVFFSLFRLWIFFKNMNKILNFIFLIEASLCTNQEERLHIFGLCMCSNKNKCASSKNEQQIIFQRLIDNMKLSVSRVWSTRKIKTKRALQPDTMNVITFIYTIISSD